MSVTVDSPFAPHLLQVCVIAVIGTVGFVIFPAAQRAQLGTLSVVQYSCVTSKAGFVLQTVVYVIVETMVCVTPPGPGPPNPGAGGGFAPGTGPLGLPGLPGLPTRLTYVVKRKLFGASRFARRLLPPQN